MVTVYTGTTYIPGNNMLVTHALTITRHTYTHTYHTQSSPAGNVQKSPASMLTGSPPLGVTTTLPSKIKQDSITLE